MRQWTIWYRPMCGLVDVSGARMPLAASRDWPRASCAWARVVATRYALPVSAGLTASS
jgi:hypothetical protein